MPFVNIYFSLGSNLGDRRRNLTEAVERLEAALDAPCAALSRFIETRAVGFSGGKFLNAVALFRVHRPEGTTEECCCALLGTVKQVERAMGRTDPPEYDAEGRRIYHSRIIDVDILFYGNETVDAADITVPHKGIADRPFVMIPLQEIARPSLRAAFPAYFPDPTNINPSQI